MRLGCVSWAIFSTHLRRCLFRLNGAERSRVSISVKVCIGAVACLAQQVIRLTVRSVAARTAVHCKLPAPGPRPICYPRGDVPKRKSSRPSEPKTQPRRAFPQWLPAAALAALAIAVYANSLANGFVGDDQFQLLRNPLVKDIGGIPRIFGSSAWSFLGVTGN